jgi:hypothetical protein
MLSVLVVGFRAIQFASLTSQVQWGYDFSFYWTAALHLLHGEPIYSAAQLAGPFAPQGQEGFLYPPPFAAFLVPLASVFPVDYRVAAWLWTLDGAIILVATVLALYRSERLGERYPILAGNGRWLLVAGAFAFPPAVGELVLGNVHLLLLGLLTGAWLGVRRGTPRSELVAGIAVGIAAVVKVFPAVLLLWFILTGRTRAALGVVVGAALFALIALPITGIQPWLDYPTVLANISAPIDATDTLAPTVWLSPIAGFTVARIVVMVAGVVLLAWSGRSGDATRSFAAAVVIAVLISPAVYQHTLAVLVLPLLLGLGAGVPLRYLAVAYFLMWGGKQEALGDLAWIVNRAMPTLGALVLLAGLVLGHAGRPDLRRQSAGVLRFRARLDRALRSLAQRSDGHPNDEPDRG